MVIKAGSKEKADEDFVKEVVYENDLKEMISDIGTGQSEFGFVGFGWLDENEIYRIEPIPQDQYFPQSDGSVIIALWKRDPYEKNVT